MEFIKKFKDYLLSPLSEGGVSSKKNAPSKVTVKNYLADINHFVTWTELRQHKSFSPTEITLQLINEFKSEKLQILSASSVERHISSLRKFFAFLKLNGDITTSPFDQVASNQQPASDEWHLHEFKNYLYTNSSSHLTTKNYLIDVKQFLTWAEEVLGVKDAWQLADKDVLGRVDDSLVEEYKNRLFEQHVFSASSINRKLSSLRKYLYWAAQEGYLNQELGSRNYGEILGVARLGAPRKVSAVNEVNDALFGGEERQDPSLVNNNHISENLANAIHSPKQYSKIPPIRLFQKVAKAGTFTFDLLITAPVAHVFKKVEHGRWTLQGKPLFKKLPANHTLSHLHTTVARTRFQPHVENISKHLYAPLSISIKDFPWYKKLWHHAQHTRPTWYRKYHQLAFAHYFNWAVLIIFATAMGVGMYNSFLAKPSKSLAALPTAPLRVLSFQGRLTDANDNPITSPSWIRFAIYNDTSATGSAKLWEEADKVSPDSDGIFSIYLGSDGNGGEASTCVSFPATTSCGIPSTLFSQNNALWLGVTVENKSELTPREQLATVAYASNSETLQGLQPITAAGAGTQNVVLALNSSGNLSIGASTTFQSTSGQFAVSGNTLALNTNAGTNGNITLAPDGLGTIDLQRPLQTSTNNGDIASVPNALTIEDLTAILATSSGQSALTINQNGAGPIISASSSGTAKFTVDNSGNTTANAFYTGLGSTYYINANTSNLNSLTLAANLTVSGNVASNLIPDGNGTRSLGDASHQWLNIYGENIYSNGQLLTSYWQENLGALSPLHTQDDLLIGGTATSDARFRVSGTTGNTYVGGTLGVGTKTPLATTDLRGNSGTTAVASVSGATSFAGLVVDNSGVGDLFTASTSGLTKFVIQKSGNILDTNYTANGGIFYTDSTGLFKQVSNASANTILHGGTTPTFSAVDLTADVTGTLPINKGGTNTASIGSNGQVAYSNGSSYAFTSGGSVGNCLTYQGASAPTWGSCGSGSGTTYWTLDSTHGTIYPINSTLDLLVGGTATASSKFAVTGIAGSLTPYASVSATTASGGSGTGVTLGGDGSIQSLINGNLTIGGNTTGDINLKPGNGSGIAHIVGTGLDSSSSTFSLFNGVTTTLNFSQQAATINIGGSGGTVNFAASTIDDSRSNVTLFGTPTTIALGGAATSLTLGATSGTTTIQNGATVNGNAVLGTSTSNTLTVNALLNADLLPSGNGSINLGSPTHYYNVVYANSFSSPVGNGTAGFWTITNNTNLFPSNYTADDLLIGGSATGSAKFQIFANSGSATTSGNLTFTSPTATIQTVNMQTLTIGGAATGAIAINPNGSTGIFVNNAGNVGIANTNPAQLLTVGNTNTGQLASFSPSAGSSDKDYITISGVRSMFGFDGTTGNAVVQGYLTKGIEFNVNAATFGSGTAMTITSSGNVGIGTTTPLVSLQVAGSASTSGNLTFYGNATAHNTNILQGGSLGFYVSPGGDAGLAANPSLYIGSNGDVGIGTTTPGSTITAAGSALDINGIIRGTSIFAITTGVSGKNTANNTIQANDWALYRDTANNNDLTLVEKTSGTTTERLVVDHSGNVGIGTTSPTALLDVAGAASVSSALTFRGATGAIQTTSNGLLTLGGNTTGGIVFGSNVTSNIIPSLADSYDLGSASNEWNNLYVRQIISPSSGGIAGYWQLNSGVLAPVNLSNDLAVGGAATSSAKFQIFGNTGNATTSGNFTFNSASPVIQTTNMYPLTIGSASTGPIQLSPKGTTGLYISDTGNVGVGTTAPTSAFNVVSASSLGTPGIKLTISGADSSSNSQYVAFNNSRFNLGWNGTNNFGFVQVSPGKDLEFQTNCSTVNCTNANLFISRNSFVGVNTTLTGNAQLVVNQSNSFGLGDIFTASSAGTTKFVISNAGNVGIGITSPSSLLQVDGTITATGSNTNAANITSTITAHANNDNLKGLNLAPVFATSTFTGLSAYGVAIDGANNFSNTGTGTINNAAGLYITAPTIGTNNFAIYSASGTNYFNSTVSIGSTNPLSSSGLYVEKDSLGNALVALKQLSTDANGDLLTASNSAGTTQFTVTKTGNIYGRKFTDLDNTIYYLDPAGLSISASIAGSMTFTPAAEHDINYLTGSAINFQRSPGGDVGLTSTLYLSNSGRVGIGTANPNQLLHLYSTGTNDIAQQFESNLSSAAYTAPTNFPSTGADNNTDSNCANNTAWTNPGNATANDGVFTTSTLTSGQSTHCLKVTNFGFSLNASATIVGIQVGINRKTQAALAGGVNKDVYLKILKAGSQVGNNKADTSTSWPSSASSASTATYGSSSDTWGISPALTGSDVNNSNFGLEFTAQATTNSANPEIDYVTVTVYYKDPSVAQGIQEATGFYKISNSNALGTNDILTLDTSTGYLGVGTTSPSTTLAVGGTASVSGILTVGNGTTNQIQSAYGPLNLNYKSGLNSWGTALTIQDSTGNVGIGTSNPQQTFNVNGTWGTNVTTEIDSLTTTQTVNISGSTGAYHLENSIGSTTGGVTITYNLTGLPSTDGSFAYVFVFPKKVASASNGQACIRVQVNGTEVFHGVTADGCTFSTTGSDTTTGAIGFIIMQTNGSWRAITATTIDPSGTSGCTGFGGSVPCLGSFDADLAEWIPFTGTKPEPGQLLVVGDQPTSVKISSGEYEQGGVGIVTTSPNTVFGQQTDTSTRVTLAGRVPAIVTSLNGPIQSGDTIATSPLPGIGMKPSQATSTVGKALSAFSPTDTTCTLANSLESITWPNDDGTNAANPCFKVPVSSLDAVTQTIITVEYGLTTDDYFYVGKVMVLVSNSQYNPSAGKNINDFAILTTNEQYLLKNAEGQIVNGVLAAKNLCVAYIQAGSISTQQFFTNSLAIATDNVSIAGQSLHDYIATIVQQVVSQTQGQAPISPVNQIATNVISPLGDNPQIQIRVKNSGIEIAKDASSSAVASIDNNGNATFSGTLNSQNLAVNGDATISGTLHADKIEANSIAGLQEVVSTLSAQNITNVTNIFFATPSAAPTSGQIATGFGNGSSSTSGLLNPASNFADIASYSAYFAYVPNLNATTGMFQQGLVSLGPTSLMDTSITGTLSVGSQMVLADTSLNVLGSDFAIQPLRQGGVNFEGGLIAIDTNGNLTVNGNAVFNGNLAVNTLSPIAGHDVNVILNDSEGSLQDSSALPQNDTKFNIKNASNSAVFAVNQLGDVVASGAATVGKLNFDLVQPALAVSDTEVVATGSAGTAAIKAFQKEVTIDNPNVTANSLIYITPVGTNQTPYLERQVSGKSFTVGIPAALPQAVNFNWLIVN